MITQMNLAIFDLDGTLTKTNEVDALCYVRAVDEEFGIDATGMDWADYTFVTDIGITNQMFQERFGRSPSDDGMDGCRGVAALLEKHASAPRPLPICAPRRWEWLHRQPDWTVAIATGCW
jgi:beta-phosphoglucomutase-like phosphatase (HAD superfamily)